MTNDLKYAIEYFQSLNKCSPEEIKSPFMQGRYEAAQHANTLMLHLYLSGVITKEDAGVVPETPIAASTHHKVEINQPSYSVLYARLKFDHVVPFLGQTLKKGSEYPVYVEDRLGKEASMTQLMIQSDHSCDIVHFNNSIIEIYTKEIVPAHKLGDVIVNTKTNKPSRVWAYTIIHGKVWYRDGWSVGTNCESGVHEENTRVATKEESQSWEVEYYDKIVKDKKPEIYKQVFYSPDEPISGSSIKILP